ncbi:FadR/GntR family transcriptional regulator [Rhizobium binxianense]
MTKIEDGAPVRRARLSHAIIEKLQKQIVTGALSPGDQLPTEQQLVMQFGVSRTVIREAISGLRANGLVEARQGSGMFVTGTTPPSGAELLSDDITSPASALELLEIRIPLEIEAAGLAAMRRSASQELAIRAAQGRFSDLAARGENTAAADFDLHAAIVEATNNHFYVDILSHLARRTIARGTSAGSPYPQETLAKIDEEHTRIVEAISDQNSGLAREEMRAHLSGSLRRYRATAMKIG